ncbi:MAG TPA: hemerythrin domain-containing protein [Actinospica sp.]|nr:hemerythrin domain-containing protein [Actinospica sp.]
MNIADEEMRMAQERPPRSVIAVLQEQHSQIRQLFAQVKATHGANRQMSFDRLRELLAIHEVGEELVLRPASSKIVTSDVTQARNNEEREAAKALAELESLSVDSAEFNTKFAQLEHDVDEHAQREEQEEFPVVNAECNEEEQRRMATELLKAQQKAPTHPHPGPAGSTTAVRVVGPFAALLDKARDAYADRSD